MIGVIKGPPGADQCAGGEAGQCNGDDEVDAVLGKGPGRQALEVALNAEAKDFEWKRAGGPQLEEMVQKMDLIDLRYVVPLIEAGGVMPRWQDLPKSARITVHNLWRLNTMVDFGTELLAVLVLSYPWRASPRKSRTHATS